MALFRCGSKGVADSTWVCVVFNLWTDSSSVSANQKVVRKNGLTDTDLSGIGSLSYSGGPYTFTPTNPVYFNGELKSSAFTLGNVSGNHNQQPIMILNPNI